MNTEKNKKDFSSGNISYHSTYFPVLLKYMSKGISDKNNNNAVVGKRKVDEGTSGNNFFHFV